MTAPDRQPVYLGVREAMAAPGLVMGASFIGFGSMIHDSNLSLWFGLASTFTGWALPGQVAMIELYGVGASLLVITVAVLLTNVRLLPLAVTLLPHLNVGGMARWRVYALAHLIAATSWTASMRRFPHLAVTDRLPYFLGFAITLWAISFVCTGAGFILAGAVPIPVSLALVFLNPVYFLLLLAGETARYRVIAILSGAGLGPLIHTISPDWSLLGAGLSAGTLAFVLEKWGPRHGR